MAMNLPSVMEVNCAPLHIAGKAREEELVHVGLKVLYRCWKIRASWLGMPAWMKAPLSIPVVSPQAISNSTNFCRVVPGPG